MPAQLALPFSITPVPDGDTVDADAIQANFDAIKKLFPLSRKVLAVETPTVVGSGGTAPAFQNSWVNFDTTTFQGARFWKDELDVVHLEGLVKSGTIGTTIFTLPAKYRPGNGHVFVVLSNGAVGRVDVAPTGNVVAQAGNNTYVSLSGITFKQEQ